MSDERLAHLHFDSSALPPDQQFPAWTALLAGYASEIDAPERGFKAVAEAWRIGPVVVTAQHLGPMHYSRSREILSADGMDGVTVSYLRSGHWRGEMGGRPMNPPPGSACLMDLTQTFWADCSETSTVLVMLPRDMLAEVLDQFDVHGCVLGGELGALFAEFIELLLRRLGRMTASEGVLATGALRELLVACVREGGGRPSLPPASGQLLARARAHIDRHLQEPLTVAGISRVLGVSRSSLYEAFAPVGGVASELRRRRLMRAHQAICRPSTASIAEVGHACGFGDPAHFSRAFRREFGATPAAVRAVARRNGAPQATDGRATAPFERWKAVLDSWAQDSDTSAAAST